MESKLASHEGLMVCRSRRGSMTFSPIRNTMNVTGRRTSGPVI
jgi:hypothetical protein